MACLCGPSDPQGCRTDSLSLQSLKWLCLHSPHCCTSKLHCIHYNHGPRRTLFLFIQDQCHYSVLFVQSQSPPTCEAVGVVYMYVCEALIIKSLWSLISRTYCFPVTEVRHEEGKVKQESPF